ncbi:unnamed protein product [Mytilus edulis]|uniref:Sacsin/Nov domain-containing protein n=1 Tax=Mytilus edulis TaxID=6550 RepID=A0A8S3SWQ1_MYTED|nr:unnamed protein product [Mytilus edulis]
MEEHYLSDTGVLEWEQEVSLVSRIKSLLKGYRDGLSVPKELIQNADDVGATQFCETDFRNITKVEGATKDLSKIGKFGVGFCSVLQSNRCSSFLSGDIMVIFDPQSSYLKTKGMKIDMEITEKSEDASQNGVISSNHLKIYLDVTLALTAVGFLILKEHF